MVLIKKRLVITLFLGCYLGSILGQSNNESDNQPRQEIFATLPSKKAPSLYVRSKRYLSSFYVLQSLFKETRLIEKIEQISNKNELVEFIKNTDRIGDNETIWKKILETAEEKGFLEDFLKDNIIPTTIIQCEDDMSYFVSYFKYIDPLFFFRISIAYTKEEKINQRTRNLAMTHIIIKKAAELEDKKILKDILVNGVMKFIKTKQLCNIIINHAQENRYLTTILTYEHLHHSSLRLPGLIVFPFLTLPSLFDSRICPINNTVGELYRQAAKNNNINIKISLAIEPKEGLLMDFFGLG